MHEEDTISNMKLVSVNYSEVAQALLELPTQTKFNTSFHDSKEAPDLATPSEAPYSFKRWLKLVLLTRNLPQSAVQMITLSRSQALLLLNATEASLQTQTVNRMYADDIADEIVPTLQEQLDFPPEGLFLRLEACSPKDGAHLTPGKIALHSVQGVILRLVTSYRARNAVRNSLADGDDSFNLFFIPFDARLGSEREYRVFCPPGGARISCVSQYQWHKPWRFAGKNKSSQAHVARLILNECRRLHSLIMGELKADDPMDKLLLEQGFSFDVFFDEDTDACQLVELNGFGVRSSCGSCLFQWVKDRELLYGSSKDIEFRVTT